MRTLTVLACLTLLVAAPARAQGEAAFAPCAGCHALKAGVNGVGPSLHGVYGRKKASVPGYAYSAALKAHGGVWSDAELNAYLTDPTATVPGTKMGFAGYREPAKRAAVIALLKANS